MILINEHINKHLNDFINCDENEIFELVFRSLNSSNKDEWKLLLKYISKVLELNFPVGEEGLKLIHIHFEDEFDQTIKTLFVELIWNIFYFKSLNSDNNQVKNKNLIAKIQTIENFLSKDLYAPSNNDKRLFKKLINQRKDLRESLNIYKKLPYTASLHPTTLINLKVRQKNDLSLCFHNNPLYLSIQNLNNVNSYILINNDSLESIKKIKLDDVSILKSIENIILYDCENNVQKFNGFNVQQIENLNQRHNTNFKKHLIITFGKKPHSINNMRNKISMIRERFKTPVNTVYTILSSEIDALYGGREKSSVTIDFIGLETSPFWDYFINEVNSHNLYELKSIKMMNLYSLCFNQDIKDHILLEIFSEGPTTNYVSDELKQRLLDLRNDDLMILKEALGNVLDLIINSGIKQSIINKTNNETQFLVDDVTLNSKRLCNLISLSLSTKGKAHLISWSSFKSTENKKTLILSYRDQGKSSHYFYPNLIETTVTNSTAVEAIFHKFLFYNRYQWAKYNLAQDLYKLTEHQVRKKYFHWDRLKDSITHLRPQKDEDIKWELEEQYSGNTERETIKLKLKDVREKTFNSSDLFIYSIDNISFRVEKIGDIINLSDDVSEYSVHNLDEIQENINIYEKIIDKNQHEEELNIIRKKFDIDEDTTGRLWKILLKKKAHSFGEKIVYDNLKNHLEKKDLKIVSLNHFQNNWLNPESDSIAPLSKKVFIELCNFLELPKLYFVLIQRLRNRLKQSSRQSTQQMNRLLQNLFNDGCFDDGINLSELIAANIEKYKSKHPLDELGIDEKYLGKNLIALVQLIKPEIRLKEIENSKRPNNE